MHPLVCVVNALFACPPTAASADASPREVDYKKFVTIWPNYIDANKTLQQGRRIPKEAACACLRVCVCVCVCVFVVLPHMCTCVCGVEGA
jgi:hypothetical protein